MRLETASDGDKSESAQSSKKSRWSFFTWQNVVGAIAGLTAAVVAMKALLDIIPPFMDAGQKAAYALGFGMHPQPPSTPYLGGAINPSPVLPKPNTAADSAMIPPQLSNDLGPSPGPECKVFTSTDYGVFPPAVTRSWKC